MTASAIADVLRKEIGLDPEVLGIRTLEVALATRMDALGLKDASLYLGRLHGAERQALIDEVIVPETWFFREPTAFGLLGERARAKRAREEGPFRVLSAACASGEEPYSAAITLLQAGLAAGEFTVDAVDVSAAAVARAREAVYGPRSERAGPVPPQYRDDLGGGRFRLTRKVRDLVTLSAENLADPALLAGASPYDAVFCRNVLIYLTTAARRRCAASLARLLAPGGILFAGNAEALSRLDDRFLSYGPGEAFAFVLQTVPARRAPLAFLPSPLAAATATAPVVSPPRPHAPLPVSTAVTPPVEPPVSWLREATVLADQGRLDEALVRCDEHLRAAGPEAGAFYLRGVLFQALHDLERAEDDFLRTLVLDEWHEEALVHLALLSERRDDAVRAAGFRRRIAEARSRSAAR